LASPVWRIIYFALVHLKLFFTQTEHEDQEWGSEGFDWAVTMRDQMLQSSNSAYEMTDDPEEADIIVFWEPQQRSQVIRIPRLRAHPLVHQFPNKVFVVSVEDAPLGVLSGLYTSLPAWRHQPHRHRTTLYYTTKNPYLRSLRASRQVSPTHLAAFVGAKSHDLRHWLFEMAGEFAEHDIILAPTPYNHFQIPQDPKLKPFHLGFIEMILDSKFSLCPRGNGPASYRVQESLALGRTPVIISDDWVPVADLDWEQFAIFVAENSLPDLPAILREYEPRWKEMGDIAKQTYESHFCQEVFALRAVEQIVAIYNVRTHDERHFFSQWDDVLAEAERQLG
jgi:Exostosin family